jgi:hypothetical protein
MAVRFRRRIKIMPGVYMNLSGSGASMTVGPRGASVSIGKRGVHANTSIPGTGLYARTRLSGPAPKAASGARRSAQGRAADDATDTSELTKMTAVLSLNDDGAVTFVERDTGEPLDDRWQKVLRETKGGEVRTWLEEQCAIINDEMEDVARVHVNTPDPAVPPKFVEGAFSEPRPVAPATKVPSLSARMFRRIAPGRVRRIEEENALAAVRYSEDVHEFELRREEFKRDQAAKRRLIEEEIYEDSERMADFLEERLLALDWPRETIVSHEVTPDGITVHIDVDLPEVEDMPTKMATPHARGFKVSMKELAPTKVRQLYAGHVHGVLFRIIGETFAALPTVKRVVASGYSQRPDATTGQVRDDYLLSVDVDREPWEHINFDGLNTVDPAIALERFALRRQMTKTGVFRPVEPWDR